jgi:hypothetical protein
MHSGKVIFLVGGLGGLLLALVAISGCKSSQKSEPAGSSSSTSSPAYSQIDYNTAGTITGTIKFAKKSSAAD